MYPNLKAELARRALSAADVAAKLGISERTFYNKLNGDTDFWFAEVMTLKNILNCPIDYLFSDSPLPPT